MKYFHVTTYIYIPNINEIYQEFFLNSSDNLIVTIIKSLGP